MAAAVAACERAHGALPPGRAGWRGARGAHAWRGSDGSDGCLIAVPWIRHRVGDGAGWRRLKACTLPCSALAAAA